MKWQEPIIIMDDGWTGTLRLAKYIFGHPNANRAFRRQWRNLDKRYGTNYADGIGPRPTLEDVPLGPIPDLPPKRIL